VFLASHVAVALCACRDQAPKDAVGMADADGYVLIDGSCRDGLPEDGAKGISKGNIVARQNDLGFVRIRSSACFVADDTSNMLGTVPCGTRLVGLCLVKNSDLGNAVGYRVRVRDRSGHRAIGYVAAEVVRAVGQQP
jgi:hypothetical protein